MVSHTFSPKVPQFLFFSASASHMHNFTLSGWFLFFVCQSRGRVENHYKSCPLIMELPLGVMRFTTCGHEVLIYSLTDDKAHPLQGELSPDPQSSMFLVVTVSFP